jgi:hypothetical protein
LQPKTGGGFDAFVAKLNPTGTALIYSTYLGGSGSDSATGIAVDASGNAYVTGSTASTDFPTQNAVQTKIAGGLDAFVANLNSAGLIYSTYLGGNSDDAAAGIALDTSGNAYITGDTSSTDFPSQNPAQANYGGGDSDAFVAKLPKPASVLSVFPASLSFAGQVVGTSSTAQTVTVANTGDGALTISSIAGSADFAQANTCGSSVAAGASCTISVTFTPTAGGTRTGTITIDDNALGTHQVTLSGTGQDFAVGISGAETVTAGQAAYYTLQIKPLGGFNETVALSCSGLPQFASCIFSPASIAPGNGPVGVSMKVTTKAPSQTFASGAAPWRLPPLRPPLGPTKGPWLWLAALATGLLTVAARRRRLVLLPALILFSVTMWVACGGGAAPSILTPGTPNGTFTVVVNATSGPLAHTATTTLVVQ